MPAPRVGLFYKLFTQAPACSAHPAAVMKLKIILLTVATSLPLFAETPDQVDTVEESATIQDPLKKTKSKESNEITASSSNHDLTVSPTFQLDALIQGFENEIIRDAEYQLWISTKKMKWLDRKKNGYMKWGGQRWMKKPSYYESLSTIELIEECFSRGVFSSEMGIHNDPLVGIESLRMFHNGFAELFKREDMWKGFLSLYKSLSSKLDPKADLVQIVIVTSHLNELLKLYGLSPLKEQVKGREDVFLAANLRVLKKFKWYLENYDPKKPGTEGSPGFFCEPCMVAQVALMLAKQVDPQRYAKIEPAVTSILWSEEQKVQDLASFINLVLMSLDGIVPYEED